MDWLSLIKELGPYLGIIFFFIYRDYRREERQARELRNKNAFIQESLVALVEKTTEALNRVRPS